MQHEGIRTGAVSIEVWDLVFCHEDTKAGRFVFKSLGRFAWVEEKKDSW